MSAQVLEVQRYSTDPSYLKVARYSCSVEQLRRDGHGRGEAPRRLLSAAPRRQAGAYGNHQCRAEARPIQSGLSFPPLTLTRGSDLCGLHPMQMMAPTMKLEGHKGAINSMAFAPHGVHLATGSYDKQIYVWEVHGECPHTLTLQGHKNAVLEVKWSSDSERIFSASADSTAAVWDVQTGYRIKKVTGHQSFVNSCCPARHGPNFSTGSDDGTARIWDLRAAKRAQAIFMHKFQVTAVCLSDDGTQLFAGSLDNKVHCWDIRTAGDSPASPALYTLEGHTDTITGVSLSPDGKQLLTNAMDSTARIWDVRPFVAGGDANRMDKVLVGHQHNFEKLLLKANLSPDGTSEFVARPHRCALSGT